MKAFCNGISKRAFVSELKKHQAADAFVRGEYWTGSKGCAVGCSLKSILNLKPESKIEDFGVHKEYETHLGIPEWLARVEDTLFEGMSQEMAAEWPVKFAQAIAPGADLDSVKVPFLVMLMKHALKSISAPKYLEGRSEGATAVITRCQDSISRMIKVLPGGQKSGILKARRECRAASDAAYYAADAADADAADAYAAYYAADVAAYAAYAADVAAYAAYAAYAAANARTQAHDRFASELLKLLRKVKGSRRTSRKGAR